MKNLLKIIGITTLFLGLMAVKGAEAQTFGITGDGHGHFMRVETRDQNNRGAESEIAFGETVFSKFYNSLNPAGSGRWHRNPAIPVKANLEHSKNLQFPSPVVALFYSQSTSVKEISRKILLSGNNFIFFGISLLLITGLFVFKGNPPSLEEPRFRVPVQIE